MSAARASADRLVSERDFAGTVLALGRLHRWRCYHTFLSIHSAPGFPDLVLVRPPRVVFAELKSDRGHVSNTQKDWLGALGACPGIECQVWRPSDWERIAAALAADECPGGVP